MLVNENNKILSRALLWKTNDGSIVMDRVYAVDPGWKRVLHNWANEQGYYYRAKDDTKPFNSDIFIHNGTEIIKQFSITLKNYNFPTYPYVDTFFYLDTEGVLHNFAPQYKNYYELKYKGKDPEHVWSDKHSASLMSNRDINYFNKFLPESADTIDLYFIYKGRMMPHIDRGRKTAFQIPIDIDLENNYTYSLKNRDLSILTPSSITFSRKNNESINQPEHWFYEWDEDAFDQYNLEKPILHLIVFVVTFKN